MNCDSGKEYRYAAHEQIKKAGMVIFPERPGTQGVQHALPPLRPRLQAEFPGGCRYLPTLSVKEGKKGWHICVLPSRTRWNTAMNTADTERK